MVHLGQPEVPEPLEAELLHVSSLCLAVAGDIGIAGQCRAIIESVLGSRKVSVCFFRSVRGQARHLVRVFYKLTYRVVPKLSFFCFPNF